MVLIPPGEFLMGSTAEEQARFIEEFRASESEYARSSVKFVPWEGPRHPVRIVTAKRSARGGAGAARGSQVSRG
jgi:formylglycine-generating enzyme required for sulfatase activity